MAYIVVGNNRGPRGLTGPGGPDWYKGNFPASNVYQHTTSGLYFAANPSAITGWPEHLTGVPCHIEYWVNGNQRHITITSLGARAGKWETFTLSGGSATFTRWRRTDTDFQRDFKTGEDVLDRFLPDGRYAVTDVNLASLLNLPEGHRTLGFVTHHTLDIALGVKFVTCEAYGPSGGVFVNRTLTATGTHTWSGWEQLNGTGGGSGGGTEPVGLNREVLQDAFTRRRGGRIGVDRAVVALRVDDPINGLINSGVAAKLAELGMPASAAHCSGSFTAPDLIALSNLGTWTTVKDWAHRQGMEVHHHGGNHQDASGDSALTRETVTSLATLQSSLPTLEVNKWMQPGVGGTNYDGFAATDKPELFYGHPAGKKIAQGHAVSSGYTPGILRSLDGKPRDGLGHLTVDAPANLAAAYGFVDEAIATTSGLCIMVHPNNLDKAGDFSTSADFLTFLEHLAMLRDTGKLEILTVSGLLCADAGTTWRAQVVRNGDFSGALAGWTGTAGWTASGGVASTSGSSPLSQSHSVDRYGWFRGGTMQLVAEVKAEAGATAVVQQSSLDDPAGWTAEKNVVLPASPNWVTVRINACVPLTLLGKDYVVTKIGRVSGGELSVRKVRYQPV